MYHYRLFNEDGSDAGDVRYAAPIMPGETIWTGDGRELQVVSLIERHDETSKYAGLAMVHTIAD